MKILITSTSFQETPGSHHKLLKSYDVSIDYLNGPLSSNELLPIVGNYDGIICSDDEYNEAVLMEGKKGRLKVISKYGVGLDKIDLKAAEKLNIRVINCPGVNEQAVAEHVIALMFTYYKNIIKHHRNTTNGVWERFTGEEIEGKRIGIIGFGNIGRRLAELCKCLGMSVGTYDPNIENIRESTGGSFSDITIYESMHELIKNADVLSLHVPLNSRTVGLIGKKEFELMNSRILIINTARAKLVDHSVLYAALENKIIGAYLCDVLNKEPMEESETLTKYDDVLITPHVASRTLQSVARQGELAVKNLFQGLAISRE